MSKVYVQNAPVVWQSSASLAVSGSATSGSFACAGYARLTGILISNASSLASGLTISQSGDYGQNWDVVAASSISACSGSGFSVEIFGNAVKVNYTNGLTAASIFRTAWQLRPI